VRRRLAVAAAVLGVAATAALAVGPGLFARYLAARVTRDTGVPVRVAWLAWNPLRATWTISRLVVAAERGRPALAARRLTARIPLSTLVVGRWRADTLYIDGLRVRLRIDPGGWSLPIATAPGTTALPLPAIRIGWASAPRTAVVVESAGVRSALRLRRLELQGETGPDGTRALLWTRGRLDHSSLALVAWLRRRPEGHRLRVRAGARALDLSRVVRLAGTSAIRDLRGMVDAHVRYDELEEGSGPRRRAVGRVVGHDVALGSRRLDGLWIRRFRVARFTLDASRPHLALGDVDVDSAEAWIRPDAGVAPGGFADSAGPWSVVAGYVRARDTRLHYTDGAERTIEASIPGLQLGPVTGLEHGAPVEATIVPAVGGTVGVRGTLTLRPLVAELSLTVTDVPLPPLAARLRLPVALAEGILSAAVDSRLAGDAVEAAGRVTLRDVKTMSPDPARPEDVAAFKELRAEVSRATTTPPAVQLARLDVEWPYLLVDRTAGGIFPFTALTSGAAGASPAVSVALDVRRLAVHGGRLDFRDATLEPPYWRTIANLGLQADDATAPPVAAASVRLTGLVDEISPITVEGRVGSRTELRATVDRLALPPFNAYLAGGAPYTVESGSVTARSEIVLERSELAVTNQVVLARLGLRSTTRSDFLAQEIGVPLTLAVSLMKDYRGEIALDLPFAGDVGEPHFSFGTVLRQAIVGAVRGALLSPLNALGRVFLRDGRIEKVAVEPVPYTPGARDPGPATRERATQIARVLQTHPGLAIRLRGQVTTADVAVIQDASLLDALSGQPRGEAIRAHLAARLAGGPPPALDAEDSRRLTTLRAVAPWPGDALRTLAVDRAASTAAVFILELGVEPGRVRVAPPAVPDADTLAAVPGVGVELREP
jgi:hypothetical protein